MHVGKVETVDKLANKLLVIGVIVIIVSLWVLIPIANWWNKPDDPPPPTEPAKTSTPYKSMSGVPERIASVGGKIMDGIDRFVYDTPKSGGSISEPKVKKKSQLLVPGEYVIIPLSGLKSISIKPRGGCVRVVHPDGFNYKDCPGAETASQKLKMEGDLEISSIEEYKEVTLNWEEVR